MPMIYNVRKPVFSGISDIGSSANTSRSGNLDHSWLNVKKRLSVACTPWEEIEAQNVAIKKKRGHIEKLFA